MHVPSNTPKNLGRTITLLLATTLFTANSGAYSVLTHEELIDLAWNSSIRPLLLAKFPGATEKQLKDAHAYAYGGSAVQDMGYYPFGRKFFSNLTHYVRSGEFVMWMLRNARTIDEYAFAIGALSHYLGDSIGHSEAINPATAIEFPKLEKKYGDKVTYGESPHGHIRTEFAFDVDELRDEAFAPPAYLEFIGFKVPRKFLERAFVATYGFEIREALGKASRQALRSYRTSVRSFIPAFAEAEVVLHGNAFPPHPDDEAYRIFSERVAQTNYERHWKHAHKGPGVKAHLLAIVVFLVPKVGGASDLAIKIPNNQTQEWYLQSMNHTVDVFRDTLHKALEEGVNDPVALANIDLDTGRRSKAGDYPLADEAYAQLLARLTQKPNRAISESLKQHVLTYYHMAGMSEDENGEISSRLATLEKMKGRGTGE
ncbi:MAG TPA: zinc dependent phospholipase C family protein [Candidatus Sulfotelmatobacter sp.]|nr:zinc dependent phospholipase C family protein [Candidatus Sulfotelmatobacter sp.]